MCIRSVDRLERIKVNFVCAKSHIAPVKPTDIHRLELVAALLLAKLISEISVDLYIRIDFLSLGFAGSVKLDKYTVETKTVRIESRREYK